MVHTKCVVAAAGPWTEQVMRRLGHESQGPHLRPTKGIHVVLPHAVLPISHAVVMAAPRDGRMMFAIPWKGATILGTTDTDWNGNPDEVFADSADVDYLLEAARYHFPSVHIDATDVIGTWAGLRPLIREEGVAESKMSREEEVTVDPSGIVAIAGGKLTTFRLMAIETVNAAKPFLPDVRIGPSLTRRLPLFYEGGMPGEVDLGATLSALEESAGVSREVAAHLVNTYGGAVEHVLALANGDRALLHPIHPALPYLRVEVLHAVSNEMTLTLEDFMVRRTSIFLLLPDQGMSVAREVAGLMGARLGWDAARIETQIADLKCLADAHMACVRGGGAGPGGVA